MGPTPLEGAQSLGPGTHQSLPEGRLVPLLYMPHHEKSTEGKENLEKLKTILFTEPPVNSEKGIQPLDFYPWHGHLRHKT